MPDRFSTPILRTKLRPPRAAARLLARPQLYSVLDRGLDGPLTLVSAPAGYGKTTLVSSWAASREVPLAWLALDAGEDTLAGFLRYFLAAVRTVDAEACPEALALLESDELPGAREVAVTFCNEMEDREAPLALVLDDLHLVRAPEVHEFLGEILNHPPRGFRLIVIGRADPPLPLARLRSKGQLVEIRKEDLRFDQEEEMAYFQEVLGRDLPQEILEGLDRILEGWAVGLHLAALSLRRRQDPLTLLESLDAGDLRAEEYLLAEVLSGQPEVYRQALLQISVLDRFCPAICESLCRFDPRSLARGFSGEEFVAWLDLNNLFLHSLDAEGVWFRFHHLVLELLRHQLERTFSPADLADLKVRAGEWLEAHGHLEEAMGQFLGAGREDRAVDLVRNHRHDLMNREEWNRLDAWLRLLPREAVEGDLDLMVLEGYILENRFRYPEMIELLSRAEELEGGGGVNRSLRGELDALLSARRIFLGDPEGAWDLSRRALATIDPDHHSERGFAAVVHAFAHQMTGRADEAIRTVGDALKEVRRPGTTYHSRLLVAICFVHWFEGRPRAGLKFARELVDLGARFRLRESESFGRYFEGLFLYETGNPGARAVLEPFTSDRKDPNLNNQSYGAFISALIAVDESDTSGAERILAGLAERGVKARNPELLDLANGFEAALRIRQGNPGEVGNWMDAYRPASGLPQWRPFAPDLTFARGLIGRGGPAQRSRAREVLEEFRQEQTRLHNRRLLVECLVEQAALAREEGDVAGASEILHRALTEARPGSLVRPFIDAGARIGPILDRLEDRAEWRPFLAAIRDGGPAIGRSSASPAAVLESDRAELTNRELEVLGYLARRFSNKEIAERMFISPTTVKRHAANIFTKLDVHRRREAVTKARSLGILAES